MNFSDKVYQLLAQGRWFFPGTPTSSTTKTGHHDIAGILLKVALNTPSVMLDSLSSSFTSISYLTNQILKLVICTMDAT
jgi:hypothetical protein